MPELPEVETVRRHLSSRLPGRRIAAVEFHRADLRYPIPVKAVGDLRGATLGSVRRRAKYLLLDCAAPGPERVVLVHLGMSGRLFVAAGAGPAEWQKHEHWRFELEGPDGPEVLRYVDARRFGALDVFGAAEEAAHPLLAALGPEPLGDDLTAAGLAEQARGCRVAVKVFLMDSHRVVGIGNIYASEACFRARVHPSRPASSIGMGEWRALVAAAREVLVEAIAAGGSTLRDFVGGDAAPGTFQGQLAVYGREGEPCLRCGDAGSPAPILRIVLGNRATFLCPGCQR